MSYYPDGDLCLIVIEAPENVPEDSGVGRGWWKRRMRTDEQIRKDNQHAVVVRRNGLRLSRAQMVVSQALQDGYEPVFSNMNKGELSVLGIVEGKSWGSITAQKLIDLPYMSKVKAAIANAINKPNTINPVGSWEDVFETYRPKPRREGDSSRNDGRGGNRPRGRYDNKREQNRGKDSDGNQESSRKAS